MNTNKIIGFIAVVALVIIAAISFGSRSTSTTSTNPQGNVGGFSGPVQNVPWLFSEGLSTDGKYVEFSKALIITPGSNQVSWRNRTGRTVYVKPENAEMGFETGTASSTFALYVATSSASTISSDFNHPGGSVFGIDGAQIATSTAGPRYFNGTTTATGQAIPVADGAYLVFQVQSYFDCKTSGACETATSTNRGISNFFARFTGIYQP